jgi:hypothetical protein
VPRDGTRHLGGLPLVLGVPAAHGGLRDAAPDEVPATTNRLQMALKVISLVRLLPKRYDHALRP